MNKSESKYFNTALLMNEALLLLLEKKDYEFITVTEICKKAGVNRSTFYLHYENIYELLEETIENLGKQFLSSFDNRPPLEMKSKKDTFFELEIIEVFVLSILKPVYFLLQISNLLSIDMVLKLFFLKHYIMRYSLCYFIKNIFSEAA